MTLVVKYENLACYRLAEFLSCTLKNVYLMKKCHVTDTAKLLNFYLTSDGVVSSYRIDFADMLNFF